MQQYCNPAIDYRRSLDDIARDYPDLWLLDRNIPQWLKERESILYDRATHRLNSCESTKGLSLGVILVSFGWMASPLAPLTAIVGACSYLMSVLADFEDTGRFCPLPLKRDSIGEIINSISSHDYRTMQEEIKRKVPETRLSLLSRYSYLELKDRAEAVMLLHNYECRIKEEVAPLDWILGEAPEGCKFLVYLRLLTEYMNRRDFSFSQEEILRLYSYLPTIEESPMAIPPQRDRRVSRPPVAAFTPEPRVDRPPVIPSVPFTPKSDRADFEIDLPEVPTDRRETNPPVVERAPRVEAKPQAPQSIVETGLLRIVADPFQSRAFFGAQRTGKSFFVAAATQKLAEQGVQTFHINLASVQDSGDDDLYWGHATSVRGDLGFMDSRDASELIARAIALVKQFIDAPSGALLICDEWTVVGRKNHSYAEEMEPLTRMLNGMIASLVSSGKQRQKAVWTIAPDMVAGGLTDGAKLAVKDLALVLIAVAPWSTVEWSRRDGRGLKSEISFSHELYGQLDRNYAGLTKPRNNGSLSSSDRIVFMDGHWYPLGVDKNSVKGTIAPGENHYIPIAGEPDPLAQEFTQIVNTGGNNESLP